MKQNQRNLIFYGQLLVIVSLPFHFLISSYAIGLLLLAFLFQIVKSAPFRNEIWASFSSNRIAQLLALGFIVYVGSIVIHISSYPDNSIHLVAIEKKLSLLIFPFLFANIRSYNDQQIGILFKVFIVSILVSTILALGYGLYYTIDSGSFYYYDKDKQSIFNNFMYHRLGSYMGMHAVYYAEYVLLTLIIWVSYSYYRFSNWSLKLKFLSIFMGAYLVTIIFLLKSASILIILLIVFTLFTAYYLYRAKDKINMPTKTIIGVVGILLVTALSYRAIQKIGSKADYFSYDLAEPGGGEWNGINLRLAKWHVAKIAIKDHWVWGVGPGNTVEVMDSYYEKVGFNYALQLHYNPHNQFLHTFLTLGILGILLLISFFTLGIINSLKKKDSVMFLFVISFMLFSMSESTLAVNKGIVFFSLFLSLFSYLPNKLSYYLYEQNS